MSKSVGNYVGVTDPAEEIFGKLMSVPDEVMPLYYELLLDEPLDRAAHPRDAKRHLSRTLAARFHDAAAAEAAETHFDRLHVERAAPDEIEEAELPPGDPIHVPALLADLFGLSRSEARRLLSQGGVRLDGEAIDGEAFDLPAARLDGAVLQVGKRRFRRLRAGRR